MSKLRGKLWLYVRIAFVFALVASVFIGVRLIGLENLQSFINQAGIFGPIIYILLRAALCFLAPFGSGPIQASSGVLFGFVPALIYSVIGSTLGYCVSFWLARRYGTSMVERLLGDSSSRVDDYMERLGTVQNLLWVRVVFFFAYDFIAFAAGLTELRFVHFAIITFVLGIPPTAMTILVGLGTAQGITVLPF